MIPLPDLEIAPTPRARRHLKWWRTMLSVRRLGRATVQGCVASARKNDGIRILLEGGNV